MLRRAGPYLCAAGVAGALWLIFPFGFPNYDTAYSLVFGNELVHGISPDYGVTLPPTPHPLAQIWGMFVAPLGSSGASAATTAVAYLALGAVAYLVYRLGSVWFDRPIGVLAALILLTREPFLSRGLRAYIDLPYLALLLGALVIESRRRRAGWPVLALLAVAGLLRPEAWLFSFAYLAYMALEPDRARGRFALRRRRQLERRELAGLVALAAAGPVAWAVFDWITTGDPFFAYTSTHETVSTQTGLRGLVNLVPQRLGTILRVPGLVGAAAGLVLSFALLRSRATIGIAAAVLAGAGFAVLAIFGLPIEVRYAMPSAALLCIFCAVGLLGWRLLPSRHRWRRGWQLVAVGVALIFVVQAPAQYDRLSSTRRVLEAQSGAESDLRKLAQSGAIEDRCRPVAVAINRAVPRLGGWLDMAPADIALATPRRQPRRGYYFVPGSGVAGYSSNAQPPPGFRRVARIGTWTLYARCPSGTASMSSSGG